MSTSKSWQKRARLSVERAVVSGLMSLPGPVIRGIGGRRAPVEGRTLDIQLGALLRLDQIRGAVDLSRHAPVIARRHMAAGFALLDVDPAVDVTVREINVAGAVGQLGARLYRPVGLVAGSPLVVFFHGGGMVVGDLDTHDPLCRQLARRGGVRIVSVDYRLAPEHPFPAGVEDVTAAFLDVGARARELGGDPARLAVMGDSAGGNFSAVVAQKLAGNSVRPALQVLLYPAVDLGSSFPSHKTFGEGYLLTKKMMDWFMDQYLPAGTDRRRPEASPIYGTELGGVAQALVYTAGFDPLRDEGKAYADKLSAAGVRVLYREYESLVHGFAQMGGAIDSAHAAVNQIAEDVAAAFKGMPA